MNEYTGRNVGARRAAATKPRAGVVKSGVRRRFGLLNSVANHALGRFRAKSDLAVWVILYRHASPDGVVRLSMADAARRIGCDVRTVRRALKRLAGSGLVKRLKRGTLAGGPSVWQLLTAEGATP